MQTFSAVNSQAQQLATRRLTRALAIEAYFRNLWLDNHLDEVRMQWEAAKRMVQQAYQQCSPGNPI